MYLLNIYPKDFSCYRLSQNMHSSLLEKCLNPPLVMFASYYMHSIVQYFVCVFIILQFDTLQCLKSEGCWLQFALANQDTWRKGLQPEFCVYSATIVNKHCDLLCQKSPYLCWEDIEGWLIWQCVHCSVDCSLLYVFCKTEFT